MLTGKYNKRGHENLKGGMSVNVVSDKHILSLCRKNR